MTRIQWIQSIAEKQIRDNTNGELGRHDLWLYCNLQTVALVVLCLHQCGVMD